MKKFVLSILIAGSVAAHAAETVAQLQSQMTNGGAHGRASAMEQFVRGFDPSQQQQGTAAIPIFVTGLSDSDSKVREFAATGLLKIASASMRVELPPNPNLPDLTSYPSAQPALLAAMSDSDPIVRQTAIGAYSLTYKSTPDIEQKIIDAFNSYQPVHGRPDPRPALLSSLVNDRSPSPVATNFLVQKIDDPQFGAAAIESLSSLKEPPPGALPKLLSVAKQRNISEPRKAALTRAIKAYGPDAQAQLQQILATPR